MRRFAAPILAALLVAGCTSGVEDPVLDNPNDPGTTGSMPAPEAISVALGDNQVVLAWSMPEDAEPAARFAVYRRLISPVTDQADAKERFLAEVTEPTHWDRTVRNGRLYGYRIAAAAATGPFGTRSDEVEAIPALFSITAAGGLPRTGSEQVNVQMNAPSGTEAVLLSESSDFAGAATLRYATSTSFTVSYGDGEKTIYAKFRLSDGSESIPVSDSVILDTRAVIAAVTFDGAGVRAPGDVVHFRLDAGEEQGTATVDLENVLTSYPLFDDGTGGDATPNDGVYERDVELPAGKLIAEGSVTGHFTDAVGNAAAAAVAGRTLTVAEAPEAVTILDAIPTVPPDAAAVMVRWTQSQSRDFESYRLYRSAGTTVDESSDLAATTTTVGTTELTDGEIAEGETYRYRVYVRTRTGLSTGSDVLTVSVPNLRPPTRVDLALPDGVGETSVGLRWTRTSDRDFAAYRIRRSTEPGVTTSSDLAAEITDVNTVLHFDTNLTENTEYFYRMFAVDQGGLVTPGAEITTRTRNLPPPAVTMNAATDVDSTGATLSWSQSDAHDFESYRLYRDRGPGVGTFSTLVAEIHERETVTYRDVTLEKGTQYYYRVFVVDDGVTPGPESTGSTGAAVPVRTLGP